MHPIRKVLISAAFVAVAALNTCVARAFTTVGDPSHPTALQAAIVDAYNSGAAGVTINPGKYVLPQTGGGNLTFNGFTRSFEIDAYNVELVLQGVNDGIDLFSCSNLTLKGATLDRGAAFGNQGRITAFGVDPNNAGIFYEVQGDAGYPTTGWGFNTVLTGNSHVPRPGCWDLGWVSTVDQLGNNKVRIHSQYPKSWDGWSIMVGDYLVSHNNVEPILEVNAGCNGCMFQDLTFYASPCWCAIREDQCTGNRYYYDKITYGPPPAGATNPPLLSTGSGFQALDDYVGPDVEACYFEGTGDDGFDLRGQLINVTAVSGSTVTVADPSHWNVNDPIRLSDDQGGYQDAAVVSKNGSLLTLNQTVTVHVGSSIQTRASNPNRNCAGFRLINDTVRDNRARGALVRGDNGLIQGCTFINNTMPAILMGLEPGYGWAEGDYLHNVLIQNNTIVNCGYQVDGAIRIGGCGSLGNQDITIRNNTFMGCWGTNIAAQDVSGLTINWNTFANTYQSSITGQIGGSVIGLDTASNVTLNSNLVTAPGPNQTGLVSVGPNVSNLVNNNPSGIATGILSGGLYKLTHRGTSQCLDVTGSRTDDGANVQQYADNGNNAQRWMITDLLNGGFKLTHCGTNKVLDVFGASTANGDGGTVNGNVVQWTDKGSTNQQWFIADNGNGSSKLTNINSAKCLDVWTGGTGSGANVGQYTDDASRAQQWVFNLVSTTPSVNLLSNPSFESDGFTFMPTGWSVAASVGSNVSYAQNRGVTPDGDFQLVNWSPNPYAVDTSQVVTGLTNGSYYTATAWVSGSTGMSAAYLYANGFGGTQLFVNIPTSGSWTKITITNILVSNGQCRVGLYSQDNTGNHTIAIDNVQFFKQ